MMLGLVDNLEERAGSKVLDMDASQAAIMAAFSTDLVHWEKDPVPLYEPGGHPAGLGGSGASPGGRSFEYEDEGSRGRFPRC